MTGVFHKSLKNLAMSLLGGMAASVVLLSCSGKVTDNAELGWKVEVAGGAQITLPRRPFGSPVEIKIVDVSGQPVGDAVMEFRLIEAKELGSGENVAADVLAKAWETEKAAMTSSDSAIKSAAAAALSGKIAAASNADGTTSTKKPEDEIEESVGRIEQFDARTNKEGKARVWIFAPTGFNKKIAVIAKAGRDAKFKPIFSHAVLSTSDTKGGARLTLSTSGSRKEKAGEEFDIWLNVRDTSDRIASSFEGVKTVRFDAAPQTSWGGFKPNFPSGEVTCEFTGGRCLIPKGPFILRVPEELTVNVALVDNSLDPITEKITVTSDNVRRYIALKSTPGRPIELTKRYDQINMFPGGIAELYAAWMDANGNYIEDLVSATWSLDSERLAGGMSATTGAKITFAPTKTGTGFLNVTSDNLQLKAPMPVIVPANDFVRWAFRINGAETVRENDGTLVAPIVKAGACVDVDVYASDTYGNVVPTVKGEHEITLKIENAGTGVVLAKDAHWGDLQPDDAELTNQKVVLNEGLARSVQKACFYDATRETNDGMPVLTASGRHNIPNGAMYAGALNINVQKNNPYKIILTRAIHNAKQPNEIVFNNAVNVCTRFTNETSSTRPCLVMQAGQEEKFRATVVDVAGNFIKYVEASYSDLAANLGTPAETTETINNVNVKLYSMTPIRAGDGALTVNCTSCAADNELATISSANRSIEYSYQIVSKNPSNISTHLDTNTDDQLTGADSSYATAGSPFKIIAKLIDVDGNFVNRKRVEIRNNLHFSQHYYESSNFDANVQVTNATVTSPGSCHRFRANTPAANPVQHSGTVDNLTGVNAELRAGFVKFNGNNDEFMLMRASNSQNGVCTPILNMTVAVTIGNSTSSIQVRDPSSNFVDIKAKPAITEIRFKNAEDNGGIDLNDNINCSDSQIQFRNNACHEILVRGVSRTLHIAAYDQYRNFIRSDEANNLVKYRWFNTPSLDNYNTAANQAKTTDNYVASTDVSYNLTHTTNLTQDTVFSNEKTRVATIKLSDSLPATMSPTGAGFLMAFLDTNPNIKTHSVVYNFSSEIATRYVVDFIEPDKATDPTVYWSSAYGQPLGSSADGRQVIAGQQFAIRIRPVDNANNGVKSYRDTKNIRITIPEFATWGDPLLKSVQATETNTATGGTNQIDVQCDFQVPAVSKYTGTSEKVGVNYIVNGPYATGSECIIRNNMNTADRRFALLNNLNQYTIYVTDLNPSTTINNPIIFTAQPIIPAGATKKLSVADRCGGPPSALLWHQSQSGITKSTVDNTVKKIGVGAAAKYQLTADERLDLFPVFTDLFGNYIGDAGSATLSEILPAGVTTTNAISSTTPQAGCKKFVFTANTATNHLTLPIVNLAFSEANVTLGNAISLPIEIIPGDPQNLNVRLLQPRTSASDSEVLPPQTAGVTEIEAGSCFSPSVRVMDADGNQVRSFSSGVTMNLGLINYYDENNEDLKELVHPGGLYKYSRLNAAYFPITSLDNGHEVIPTIPNAGNAGWLTPKSYKTPSEMDEREIFYFGSEKSDRLVTGGELNIIDRFVCLMDATSGLRPNLRVALDIDPTSATRYIFGETLTQQDVRVRAGSASIIDFREIRGAVRGRLCHQSFTKVGFPVLRVLNQEPTFSILNAPTCRFVRVSNSPFQLAAYFTDKVGNAINNGAVTAGAATGSWNVSQAPLDASICNVLNATGNVCPGASIAEFTGLTKKGTIAATWSAPAGVSGDYGSTSVNIPVRSGDAARISIISPRETFPTTDETFALNVKLQDDFGNDFDAPVGFSYPVTANITYTGLFSTDAGAAAPNGDTSLSVLKPASAALQFIGGNVASTGNIFRIRRANASTAAGIQISMPPALGLSAYSASFPLTILPGAAFTNDIYYSDTTGAKKDFKLLSLESNASNVNPLTAGSGKQQIEVRALDKAGNITSSPAVNFSYVGSSTLAPLQPHPSLTYSAYIPLNLAGVGTIKATLVGSTTSTQQYKVTVSPANASKLKLVRVVSATDATELASNTSLAAGGYAYFKILATDDQDNIVDQFNRSNVSVQWNFGTYPQRAEGGRAVLPGCSTESCATPVTITSACQFVAGVCRQGSSASDQVKIFTARLLGATGAAPGILEAKALTDNSYTGTFGVNVEPGNFHHFGVIPVVTEVEAKADKSAKFSVDVEARDEFGNKLSATNTTQRPSNINSAPISLVIRREDGASAASGTLDGLPANPPILGTADSVRFENLAYDEAGNFRILAHSTSNLGMSTVAASPIVVLKAVEATVARYRLAFGAGVNEIKAGQETTFRLEAVDNYNNPVRGIDSILRSHVYTWGGLSAAATVNGMSRPADEMPVQFNSATSGQFIDGVALFKGKLYRAANNYLNTLSLNNTKSTAGAADDSVVHLHPTQLTTGSATGNISSIVVIPSELKRYNVIATANSATDATSLAANTSINADSQSGLFRLVVQPIDLYGNLRKGEAGITLTADKGSNTLIAGIGHRQSDPAFEVNPLNLTSDLAAGAIGYSFDNLYYRVAQPVSWTLSNVGAGITVVPSVSLNYTATLNTVNSYMMKVNNSENDVSVMAGTDFALRIEAVDEKGNIVKGIDSTLTGLTFGVVGPEAINGNNPSTLTSFSFSNGVATKSDVKFFKAQTFLSGSFALNENGSSRQAKNKGTLTINPAAVSTLVADPIPSQKAGTAFTITVRAKDQYGNPSNTNCADPNNNQTFPINMKGVLTDGTTADQLSSSGAGGGTITHAFANASAEVSIARLGTNTGIYETSLTLYKKGENKLKFEGCPNISSVSVVMVNESDKANVMRLNNSSTPPSGDLAAELECNHTNSTGKNLSCPTVYAFLWDQYGNSWRAGSDGVAVCSWSYTSLVPNSPISTPGNVTGLVQTSLSQTLVSDAYMSGNLRCLVAAANSQSNTDLYKDVRLFGGLAGLGGRDANNALVTTGVTTEPANLGAIQVGSNNLRITKVALLQYRGGSVAANGSVSSTSTLLSTARARAEEYSFERTGTLPASAMPTNLVRNHDANGNMDGEFAFSFTTAVSGNIKLTARGVSANLENISVGVGTPVTLKVGTFKVAGVEKQSVVAGDLVTLDSVEVLDASGNKVCNAQTTAEIESSELMTPAVCGTDLNCTNLVTTLPGSKPADFDTYALKTQVTGGYSKSFNATATGLWTNAINFKLYRASLAFRVTVRACGLSKDFIFSVAAAPLAHARLADQEDPPSAATITPEIKCPLGDGLGVRCPTINAFYWDTYGNRYGSGTCTSWAFERPGSSSSAENGAGFTLAANNTTKTIINTTNANYLSGRLSCTAAAGVNATALVYGGLSAIAANHTYGGAAGAKTAVAAADNFKITKVLARFRKPRVDGANLVEDEIVKNDFAAGVAETITFGSGDARSLTEATLPIASTSTTFACTFDVNGECNPAAAVGLLSFRKVEANPRDINISLRGRTFAIDDLAVTPRGANSMQVGLYTQVADENTKITTDTPMTAGASVGAKIRVFDEFNNPTSILKNQTAAAQACVPAANDITGSGLDGNNSRLSSADRLLTKDAEGVYTFAENRSFNSLNGFTITKAGTHTLTFKACGLTDVTMNVKVNPATHAHTRVTLTATAPTATAADTTISQRCALNTQGPGADCGTLYAWFYDAYYNRIADGVSCTNWVYTKRNTTHPSDETKVALSLASNAVTTRVTSTDFMDGNLMCDFANDALDRSIHLYGGIHSIAAVINNNPTTVNAGTTNAVLSKVVYNTPTYDAAGANYALAQYPVALTGEDITLTTNASPAVLGNPPAVVTPAFKCNFAANGECTTPQPNTAFNLNFTKVESARTITVTARGKSWTNAATPIDVLPGNAIATYSSSTLLDAANVERANNNLTADDIFGINFLNKDAYGNPTNLDNTGAACAATNSTTSDDTLGNTLNNQDAYVLPTDATNNARSNTTGTYILRNLQIKKAGSAQSITFTNCGIARTLNFNVSSGAAKEYVLNQSATVNKTPLDSAQCATLTGAGGATCNNVYAYFYDLYGNHRPNDTCNGWTLTKIANSGAPIPPWSNQAGSSSIQVASLNAFDATLACVTPAGVNEIGTAGIHLYGGFSLLEVGVSDTRNNGFITAGNNNLNVSSIRLKSYVNGSLQDALYTGSYQVSYSTTANPAPNGTVFTATPNENCTFTNGVCNTAKGFTFANADSTDRTLSVSVFGVSGTINGDATKLTTIKVAPAAANAGNSTHSVLDSGGNLRSNNNLTADETFGINFLNKDAFGNPTNLDNTGAACAATDSTTSNDTLGNTPNNQDAYVLTTGAANNARSNTIGTYFLSNLQIKKAGNAQSITFTNCGIARTLNFNVSAGATKEYVLNQSATVDKNPVDSARCETLNGSGGATCANVYAYFYDMYGNHRPNETCNSWTLTKFANSGAPNPPWSNQGGSSSIQVASLNAFDATLVCVPAAGINEIGTAGIHLYGGFSALEVVVSDTRDGDGKLTAGADNFEVSSVTLKGHRQGSLETAVYGGTFDIKYTTNANASPNGTIFTTTPTHSCAFTNGVCNTAKKFSFTNADNTDKALTLSVMGISNMVAGAQSDKLTTIKVAPAAANAASSTHALLDSGGNAFANNMTATLTADDKFGLNIFNKDSFGNLTDKNTTGTACNTTTTLTESIANNPKGNDSFVNPTGGDNLKVANTVGTHQLRNMQITLAGTNHPIKFTTCGVDRNLTFNINGGAVKSFYVTDSNSAVKTDRTLSLPCSTLNEGGGATCANVYAYFYDDFDNQRANDTCDKWTLTDINATNTTRPWEEQAASASIQVTSFSALDATLACIKNVNGTNTTKSLKVYGGFKQLKVTATHVHVDGANTAYLKAKADNLQVNQITLRGYNNGALVDAPHSGSYRVTFSTTASNAPNGAAFTTDATPNCTFTNGVCTLNKSFTFARADETARSLNITVKGISSIAEGDTAKLSNIKVKADTPSSFTTNLPASVTATTAFTGKVELFDAFSNPSCDTLAITMPNAADTQSPNGTNAAGPSTRTATTTGVFDLPADAFSLPKVSSTGYNIGFSGCSSGTFNHLVKVTEGAVNKITLLPDPNRTAAQVQADRASKEVGAIACKHTATSGAGVVCDAVYAYLLDSRGNLVTDGTKQCTWAYTAMALKGAATTPVTAASGTPAAFPNGRALTISHTAYLDGTIKCTVDAINSDTTPTVRGGISRVALKVAKTGSNDLLTGAAGENRDLTAGNDNLDIKEIALFTRADGDEVAASNVNYTLANENLEVVTTAVKSVMPTASAVVPAGPKCSFSTGTCNAPTNQANAALKLSLTRAGAAGMNDVAVKVRGVTSNNISMVVNAGATTIVTATPVGTQVAGTQFDLELKGFDAQENPSWSGCTSINMAGGLSSLTGPGNTALAPALTQPTIANNVATAKVTLYAAGNHQLQFSGNGCTFNSTTTVAVGAATANKTVVSTTDAATVADIPAWRSNDEAGAVDVACTTLNNDNGVTCPTLYAYKYDTYGNKTATATGDIAGQKCAWQRRVHGGNWEAWTGNSDARSATRISDNTTPAIDELVKCDTGSNHVRLFGGPASLEVATTPAATLTSGVYVVGGTELLAGFSNLTLSDVALKSRKAGALVPMPGLNAQTQTINLTNVDFANNTFGADAQLAANSNVFASSITNCSFNASGECYPSANMNFKRLETAARKFRVTVRGISADVQVPQVVPGLATDLTTDLPANFSVNSYTDKNTSITVTVNAKDQFGNTTSKPGSGAANCDLAVSGNDPGAFPDSITYTQPSTASLKIYKAKQHTLTFTKCGLSKAQNITITAGNISRTMLTRDNTQPVFNCVPADNDINASRTCAVALTCGANAVGALAGGDACGIFYAWAFDKVGNPIANAADNNKCATGLTRSYTATAPAETSPTYDTTPANGFEILASANKYLDGALKCDVTATADRRGGTQYNIVAPLTVAPPEVNCTPWIYIDDNRAETATTSATPYSLCQFKNTLPVTLVNPTLAIANNYTAQAVEADPIFESKSWGAGDIAANSIAQFIVKGAKAKTTKKFTVTPTVADPTRVVLAAPQPLRVPLRTAATDNTKITIGQNSATNAGADLGVAEVAEADGTPDVSYSGTTVYRRAAVSVRLTTTTQQGATTTGWTVCDTTRRCSGDINMQTNDVATNTTINLATTAAERFVVHPFSTEFMLTNGGTCGGTSIPEKNLTACNAKLKYEQGYAGLRGVFLIRDTDNFYFYHLTQPIPAP